METVLGPATCVHARLEALHDPENNEPLAMTGARFSLDTRTREAVLSVIVVMIGLGAILIVVHALDLASDRLLKFGCINVIAGIGLGLFSGTTGILSLGHVMFLGVGAYVASWFTLPVTMKGFQLAAMPDFIQKADYSLWLAVIPAIVAAMAIAAFTGAAVARLRDTSAVIATFGFLVISYLLFIGLKPLTNGKQSLIGLPQQALSWPLILTLTGLAIVAAFAFKSSRLARAGEAVRDDELAAKAIGIRPNITIYWTWVISAGFMGLAGALFAHAVGVVTPNSFYLEKTFALMVIIILGGYRAITGCVIGAVLVTVLEEVLKNIEDLLGSFHGETVLGFFRCRKCLGSPRCAFRPPFCWCSISAPMAWSVTVNLPPSICLKNRSQAGCASAQPIDPHKHTPLTRMQSSEPKTWPSPTVLSKRWTVSIWRLRRARSWD